MSQTLPPAALLVEHSVADYDAWKRVFTDNQSSRKDASALGHHVNRGADDPNRVHIYCPIGDIDKAKAFMESPDLGEIMRDAGVVGPPTITFMTPRSADFIPGQELPGIIVKHAVESYDNWRVAYDAFDAFRQKSGIVGHAVNQEIGKPNHVIIYHQANDLDSLRRFVDAPELEEAMQKAGVAGPPDIQFVQAADYAEY